MFVVYHGSFPALIDRTQSHDMVAAGERCFAVSGRVDDEARYVSAHGTLAVRPSMNVPTSRAMTLLEEWDVAAPEGTSVMVNGEVVGTADEDGLTLTFPLPAVYSVEFFPPVPWLGGGCTVTVE